MALVVRYTCRYCGREAIVGRHRCRAERRARRQRATHHRDPDSDLRCEYEGEKQAYTRYPWNKFLIGAGIAALTAAVFTLVFIGPIGLLFLLLLPTGMAIHYTAETTWLAHRGEYREFIRQCQGDKARAERLIAAEMRVSKSLSRAAALRAAKQRLERDRRA